MKTSLHSVCLSPLDTQIHHGVSLCPQGQDGRKSVIPHAVWVSSDVDRGVLSYLCDALQVTEDAKEQRRTVRRP